MSVRALSPQFAAVKEKALDVGSALATFGRMATVGHLNYRDVFARETPEEKASADRGYAMMGRGPNAWPTPGSK